MRINTDFTIILLIAALTTCILYGCNIYKLIEFENEEFTQKALPGSINKKIYEKYSTNNILLKTIIIPARSEYNEFKIMLIFFSKEKKNEVYIKNLKIITNKKEINCKLNKKISEWMIFPGDKLYLYSILDTSCLITGVDILNKKIELSVEIESEDQHGNIDKKNILSIFSRKEKYFIE